MRFVIISLIVFSLSACGHMAAQYSQSGSIGGQVTSLSGGQGGSIGGTPVQQSYLTNPNTSRDRFKAFQHNGIKLVSDKPVSTFSVDVDTTSYAFIRRMLKDGHIPREAAVRVEEMINYFPYNYAHSKSKDTPFKANVALYPTPWNKNTKLLHIGIKGYSVIPKKKLRSNLVFLIDVSGSMDEKDKLPLLKKALRLMVNRLDKKDTIAIVTYSDVITTVLPPTKISQKIKILRVINGLYANGGTAGGPALQRAYHLAETIYDPKAVNKILLATDGDFNIGISTPKKLKAFIEQSREKGISLSVLGFGQGNYNDEIMQALAQNGNGSAIYIDNLMEAKKALVDQAASLLFTIAKDVKIQVEFNPAQVAEYRLIGYETRKLKREDFNNDKVDAGDIGSGHTVTAIYEITTTDSKVRSIDPLRYGRTTANTVSSKEYAFLKIRYKKPGGKKSRLMSIPITRKHSYKTISSVPQDMVFAASVAAFGQKLRGGRYLGNFSYEDILDLARKSKGIDKHGYRGEFIGLVDLAKALDNKGS